MWWILMSIAFASDINVLVIDTGASSKNIKAQKYLMNYDESLDDHGPAIINTILSNSGHWVCDNVKIDVCSFKPGTHGTNYLDCLKKAKEKKYDIVNMSLNGIVVIEEEKRLIVDITKKSVVVVAAGNNGADINGNEKQYPSCYLYSGLKNFYVINNLPSKKSNYGDYTITMNGDNILTKDKDDKDIFMSGTSFSAARYTHAILHEWCRRGYGFNTVDNELSNTRRGGPKISSSSSYSRKQLRPNKHRFTGGSRSIPNKTGVFKSKTNRH